MMRIYVLGTQFQTVETAGKNEMLMERMENAVVLGVPTHYLEKQQPKEWAELAGKKDPVELQLSDSVETHESISGRF